MTKCKICKLTTTYGSHNSDGSFICDTCHRATQPNRDFLLDVALFAIAILFCVAGIIFITLRSV